MGMLNLPKPAWIVAFSRFAVCHKMYNFAPQVPLAHPVDEQF
jgi:hypothetical protein